MALNKFSQLPLIFTVTYNNTLEVVLLIAKVSEDYLNIAIHDAQMINELQDEALSGKFGAQDQYVQFWFKNFKKK